MPHKNIELAIIYAELSPAHCGGRSVIVARGDYHWMHHICVEQSKKYENHNC